MKKTQHEILNASIENLADYINKHAKDFPNNEDCSICMQRRNCSKAHHYERLKGILETDPELTKHPHLLRFIKKVPFILYIVPKFIFYTWDGYKRNLGCPSLGIIQNIQKIQQCWGLLSDEMSKRAYFDVLMYRLTFNCDYLNDAFSESVEYFDVFSGLSSNEVVVDCGAFTGDSLEAYLLNNAIPQKYILYEPDHGNAKELEKTIKRLKANDYCIVRQMGIGSDKQHMYLCGDKQAASYLMEECGTESLFVEVTSVDCDNEIFNLPVSLIKMDIEGYELKGLLGAKETIHKYSPKLAICLYHKPSDLWEIILLIKELNPEYSNYIIRHYHKYSFTETILYVY